MTPSRLACESRKRGAEAHAFPRVFPTATSIPTPQSNDTKLRSQALELR